MTSRQTLLSTVSILALVVAAQACAGNAQAADLGGPTQPMYFDRDSRGALPAVSGLNAKVGAFGASLEDEAAGGAFIGLAFPLRNGFGAQIDGILGGGDGSNFHGVAGHLFWRDPSRGLLGAYVSHFRWDGSDSVLDLNREIGKVGAEAHLYRGRLSLEGMAAYQFGTIEGFAGKGTIAYYPHDDFRVHLGVTQLQGPGFATFAGLEWAPMPGRGMSLFADVGVDEDRDVRTVAGIKFYLSPESKSLIRRHREDDPDVDLPNDLFQGLQARGTCPAGTVLINGFCDGNT